MVTAEVECRLVLLTIMCFATNIDESVSILKEEVEDVSHQLREAPHVKCILIKREAY